jgi:hypothetical protein
MADKGLLSERADQIWAHNSHLHHDAITAVSSETDGDGAVAAVQPSRGGQNGRRGGRFPRNRKGRGPASNGQPRGGGAQATAATPWQLARQSAGLCETKGGMATTRSTVPTPPTASGRETELPGVARRHHRRVTGTHSGREFWHAVFGGYRCQF